jgi:hypothetical protein
MRGLRLQKHPEYEDVYLDQVNRLWRIDERGLPERTYDSWEKRKTRLIIPRDETAYPTAEDKKMIRILAIQLRQDGHAIELGVRRSDAISALREVTGKKRGGWTILKRLWVCGLMDRTGTRWNEGARWRDQLWIIRDGR